MIDTDRHWEKWGQEAPYFGVLSNDRFASERISEHRDEFFASGEEFIAGLVARYEREFGALARGRALDHGCGVARLTLPLAMRFDSVVALDVSPAMLAEAESNARERGIANVQFERADDALARAGDGFDFVNSHLVLQHIPVRRGLPILLRLIAKVNPGGGFHISVSSRIDPPAQRLLYWASANIPGVKGWQNLCARRPWNAPAMQMNNYPLKAILQKLASEGMGELLLSVAYQRRFITCSLIGRKPPQS
jgi:SAM-dependent methyltransferase